MSTLKETPASLTMVEPGPSRKRRRVRKKSSSFALAEDTVEDLTDADAASKSAQTKADSEHLSPTKSRAPKSPESTQDPVGPNGERNLRGGVRGVMLVVAVLLALVAAFCTPHSAISNEDTDAEREEWLENFLSRANQTVWEMNGGSGGLMLSSKIMEKAASNIEKAMAQLQVGKVQPKYREEIQDFLKELSMLVVAYKNFNDWVEDIMLAERSILDLLAEKLPALYKALRSRNEDLRMYLVKILTDNLDDLEVLIKNFVTSHKDIQARTKVLKSKVEAFRKAREESADKHEQKMIDNFLGAVGVASTAATFVIFSPLILVGAAAVPVVTSAFTGVGIGLLQASIGGAGGFWAIRQSIESFNHRAGFHSELAAAEVIAHFDDGLEKVMDEMKRRTLTLKYLGKSARQTKHKVTLTTTSSNKETMRTQVEDITNSAQQLSKVYTSILGYGPPQKEDEKIVIPAHNYYG